MKRIVLTLSIIMLFAWSANAQLKNDVGPIDTASVAQQLRGADFVRDVAIKIVKAYEFYEELDFNYDRLSRTMDHVGFIDYEEQIDHDNSRLIYIPGGWKGSGNIVYLDDGTLYMTWTKDVSDFFDQVVLQLHDEGFELDEIDEDGDPWYFSVKHNVSFVTFEEGNDILLQFIAE